MPRPLRIIVGLILVFLVHVPRLLFAALELSYAWVFHNRPLLTASPREHLKRAKKILRRKRLSELLYAALEIRFALERMSHLELVLAEAATKRMLKEYSPTKKISNLNRIDPESKYAHEIYFVNKETGERIKWAEYTPLDKTRVTTIQGRLGDLLHPKEGLLLGIESDPWYTETRSFLQESLEYLWRRAEKNRPFFSFRGLEQFEMVRQE